MKSTEARLKGLGMLVAGIALVGYSLWQLDVKGWLTPVEPCCIPLVFLALLLGAALLVMGLVMLISGIDFLDDSKKTTPSAGATNFAALLSNLNTNQMTEFARLFNVLNTTGAKRLGVFLNGAAPDEVKRLAAEINSATPERIGQLAQRLNRGEPPFG